MSDWIELFMREQSDAHSGLELFVDRNRDGIVFLQFIRVSRPNKGTGTQVMQALCEQADAHGDTIRLMPSGSFGSDFSRLKKWYQSFGFRPYEGDPLGEEMIRYPNGTKDLPQESGCDVPTPEDSGVRTPQSGGLATMGSVEEVRNGIARAVQKASEGIAALQQAILSLEEAQQTLSNATQGNTQEEILTVNGMLAEAEQSIIGIQGTINASISVAESYAGRL